MLEAIRSIGEGVLIKEKKPFIQNIVIEIDQNQEKENLILILNFNLNKKTIELEKKEISSNILQEYLWVGNAKGNNPQDRLTNNNLEYFLSQTIYNLYKNFSESDFKYKLKEILNEFYIKENLYEDKEMYLLDISKISGLNINYKEIINELSQKAKNYKKFLNEYTNKFFELLKSIFLDVKKKDFVLYSIEIDGKKPNEIEEYIYYLENKILNEPFQEESLKGLCHVCGKETELTADTSNLVDKFYIQKLLIFASNFDKKNFSKNFSLCKDCYKQLIAGSSVLKNKLNFYFAGSNIYLIPSFVFPLVEKSWSYDFIELEKLEFNSILNIEDFLELNKRIQSSMEDYIKYQDNKNYINFNLLFYEKEQASFKIQRLIKDIPARRRDEIYNAINIVKKLAEEILGDETKQWVLTLNKIYYYFPVRLNKRRRSVDYKKVLDFYDALFLGKKINLEFLIKNFVEMIKIYRFEKFFPLTQIKRSNNIDIGMIYSILQTNLLIKMLEILNILNGGENMIENLESLGLNEEIKNYIKEMNYSEDKLALFLLGYLIGEIGNAQRTSLSEKKPILEKINYHGMNIKKILILINEVFEKLNQYKIRQYNETNFAIMKMLFDKNINKWKLSDIDNVYYILSGYAFNTYKIITSKKQKEVNNE